MAPGEARTWFRSRRIAKAKLPAVTGVPSLKRNPRLSVNVYARPPSETRTRDATSGTSFPPRDHVYSVAAVASSSHDAVLI